MEDYYIEFSKLANQSSTMTNEERMSWFVAHLKPDLRQHCNMQECKTLEEAYSKAVHKETFTERLEPHTSAIYYTTSQQQPFSNIKIDGSSLPLQEKKVNFAQPHQNQNKSQISASGSNRSHTRQNNNNNNNNSNYNRQQTTNELPLKNSNQVGEVCCIC